MAQQDLIPTPAQALGITPCMKCMSQSELLILFLYMMAYLNSDSDDLPGLLETSKCWDCSSLSDTDLLRAVLNVMANAFNLNATEIAAAVKCMPCARPGQIKGAIAYSIAKYFTSLPT